MEKTDSGWKVYNMKIEGISLIENYRNTFNTEVQKNGVEGLGHLRHRFLGRHIESLAQHQRQREQHVGHRWFRLHTAP